MQLQNLLPILRRRIKKLKRSSTNRKFFWLAIDLILSSAYVACCTGVQAQTALQFDDEIANNLQRIDQIKHEVDQRNEIDKINNQIRAIILKNGANDSLMKSPLKRSKTAGLWTAESPDQKIRVYSWDTESGGTAHSYASVIQFKVNANLQSAKFSLDEKTANQMYYSELKQFIIKSGETVYLALGAGTESTDIYTLSAETFTIANGKLKKFDLYQTPKHRLSTIFVEERMDSDATIASIEFENQNRTMKVPLIDKDLNNTGGFLVYKFNGNKFVFAGTK